MEFEWDADKADLNWRKHRISFEEAASVFGDWLSVTVHDPDHSLDESRFLMVGMSSRNRLLIVSYSERSGRIRIISARELTRSEKKAYEAAQKKFN